MEYKLSSQKHYCERFFTPLIFNKVLKKGGYIKFKKPFKIKHSWKRKNEFFYVKEIFAYQIPKEIQLLADTDWNKFCEKTHIISNTKNYIALVRTQYNTIGTADGIIVLKWSNGEEIKTKHWDKIWKKFYKFIKNKY